MSPVIAAPENTAGAWSERATIAEPWTACGWSAAGQYARHTAAIAALDPKPGERLLDWACGTGELFEMLPDGVAYLGYDRSDGMVDRARRDHAGTFQNFEPTSLAGFDLIACIGPFNLPDGWSKTQTWQTLHRLWEQSRCRALVASLYAGDDPNCLIYTEQELWANARLSWNVHVTRILPNDLMLEARR